MEKLFSKEPYTEDLVSNSWAPACIPSIRISEEKERWGLKTTNLGDVYGSVSISSSVCYKFTEVLILAYSESYWDRRENTTSVGRDLLSSQTA